MRFSPLFVTIINQFNNIIYRSVRNFNFITSLFLRLFMVLNYSVHYGTSMIYVFKRYKIEQKPHNIFEPKEEKENVLIVLLF
jgi:predicted membrane protein